MKTMRDLNKKKVPAVRIEPPLDKYDNVILFPGKLAKENENLKKAGFPKLSPKKHNR